MARLPYPDPDQAPEPVRDALAGLPPLNIFRMLAHAETALRPFLRFGAAILGRLELDPRLRELAILQVAASTEARYEWVQHVEIGREVGLTDAQIAAVELGDGGALGRWSARSWRSPRGRGDAARERPDVRRGAPIT